jgi:hypothetical protein
MALVDLGPPCARDWVALLGGHRIELVRKLLQEEMPPTSESTLNSTLAA